MLSSSIPTPSSSCAAIERTRGGGGGGGAPLAAAGLPPRLAGRLAPTDTW